MAHKTESVDVAVPVRTAYNQWTQFEQFPRFMRQVKEVRQVNDTLTHWTVEINGVRREFDAQITEQQPDRRIAWTSINGMHQRGMVTFEPIDSGHTRVTAEMDLEPSGFAEHVADATGMIGHSVHEDLANFKEFIEHQGAEAGAWRGRVEEGRVTGSSADITAGPAGPGRSTGLSDPSGAWGTGRPDPGMPATGTPATGTPGTGTTGTGTLGTGTPGTGTPGMTAPAGERMSPRTDGMRPQSGMTSPDGRVTPQTMRERVTPTHGAGSLPDQDDMLGPDAMTASGGGAMAGLSAPDPLGNTPDPLDDPLLDDPRLNDPGMDERDERMQRDAGAFRDEHGRDRYDRDPDQPGTWRHPDA